MSALDMHALRQSFPTLKPRVTKYADLDRSNITIDNTKGCLGSSKQVSRIIQSNTTALRRGISWRSIYCFDDDALATSILDIRKAFLVCVRSIKGWNPSVPKQEVCGPFSFPVLSENLEILAISTSCFGTALCPVYLTSRATVIFFCTVSKPKCSNVDVLSPTPHVITAYTR